MTTDLALAPAARCSLRSRLEREWVALRGRPSVLRRAAGWGLGITFCSLDDIVVASGYCASSAQRDVVPGRDTAAAALAANEVLRRLLLAARTDDLAGRVVLQRLVPGLAGRAYRWGERRDGGSADAFDELVSALWTVIRDFPVERRPHHLAANLLRDSEYRVFVRASRRRLVHELTDPHLFDLPIPAPEVVEPADELAEVIAGARALTDDERLLVELLAQGRSPKEVASALHISERTVRNHRDVVVHRLRMSAAA